MAEKVEKRTGNSVEVRFPGGERLILIGTAHVSRASVVEVEESILHYSKAPRKLAKVFLELDAKRLKAIEDRSFRDINIREILRSGQGYFFLAYLLLSLFQRKIAEETGSEPGGEFKVALQLAREYEILIELIDRPADITLRRAWRKMSLWQQLKFFLGGWGFSLGTKSSANESSTDWSNSEAVIEELKNQDKIAEMMMELEKPFPTLKAVVIDERDRYMAENIRQQLHDLGKDSYSLAVVGAGHVRGMLDYWQAKLSSNGNYEVGAWGEGVADSFFKKLEWTPPPHAFWKTLKYAVPAVVLGAFVWGFYRSDWEVVKQAFLAWVLSNGILSALGALVARAHPATVLVAFLASPLTSLNPTIGAGLVAAWFEAYVRSPSLKDLETVQLRLSSFRGWWKNQLTKVMLVFIFVSLGSALGTWVALPFLFRLFS